MRYGYLLALCLLLCPACAKPPPHVDGNLVFYDKAGNKIASAQIAFPDDPVDVPADSSLEFTGTYDLLWSNSVFPDASMSQGRFKAQAYGSEWFVDLNDGAHDHNVILFARRGSATLQGEWHHATFAGSSSKGAFTLTRPTPGPTPE
ncbi:hypothetical protein OT109_11055 [Phycisphaeraceae bacterium D3-23]